MIAKIVNDPVAVIILAAGLGTRMKSNKAKVLHELLDRPMILYVVETARQIVEKNITLVVGHQADEVRNIVSETMDVTYAHQEQQLGTAHAVNTALPFIPDEIREIIILYGDVPLLTTRTIRRLLNDHHAAKRDITVLGVEIKNPTGYGRILQDEQGKVLRIVEETDASAEQKQVRSINTGIYCIKKNCLIETLRQVSADNAQGEYYLTDIIEIGNRMGKTIGAVFCDDADEVVGINTWEELNAAEALIRMRLSKTA
ncbi:MAG TPA: NTP transferase domain-containing protein [Deltaproteobacteria bacterium]|nr:NTP transferase domain-containing protein [Deltaproteobacteria bacterium]